MDVAARTAKDGTMVALSMLVPLIIPPVIATLLLFCVAMKAGPRIARVRPPWTIGTLSAVPVSGGLAVRAPVMKLVKVCDVDDCARAALLAISSIMQNARNFMELYP